MTRAAVVLLATAALFGPSRQLPPRDGVPQPTSGTGTIRGRVVTAANGARDPDARPIHLGTDEVVDVVFELARGAAIAGTVVDDTGEPVSGASVMLEAVADSHSPTRTPTPLPPGDYYVAAYDKRQVGTADGEIDDLDVLETFVAGSQRVALAEGQRATLSLSVAR